MDEWIAGKNGHGPDDDPAVGHDSHREIPKDKSNAFAGRAEAYLVDAIESIPGGFALFDADDRLVLCNSRYRDVHPVVSALAVSGARFEDMARGYAKAGLLGGSEDEIDAIVEKRLSYHRNTPSSHELQLNDGRWVEIRESRTHDGGTVLLWTNITDRKRAEILQAGRNKVLERLATEGSLEDVLTVLVTTAEEINPDMLCSVLLLDDDGECLRHGAAPSLPDDYNQAVDGTKIGRKAGSCGAAAFLGETVIVEDIQTHPNWKGFKDVAGKAGLRACWSQPIVTAAGKVMGTFAMYYREPRKPTPPDLEIIEDAARLAGIAIEHKRMKETARQNEERLLGAIESLQDAFALYDSEDRLIAFNDSYRKIRPCADEIMARGGTFEDLLHENIRRGVISEAVGREEAFIKERLEQHRNPSTPMLRQGLDDGWYILDEVKTPEGGTALSFTDVSVIKRAEEALRESEERFRGVIECSPGAIVIRDLEGRNLIANKLFCDWHGLEREEILDKTAGDFLSKEIVKDIIQQERKVAKTKTTMEMERRITFPNGVTRDIFSQKFPIFGPDGDCVAIGTVINDITERKRMENALRESEERFRDFSETASDWFWEMDENLRFSYFSDG
ncbi:MAG: PAS-domain containing protein [Proteobacteria bacterium]|nr:PAS-domain containing protein [Pseudomonadota bacterium]